MPAWLVALEEEVDDVLFACSQGCTDDYLARVIPPLAVPFDEAKRELEEWASRKST